MKVIEPNKNLNPLTYDLGIYPVVNGYFITEEVLKIESFNGNRVTIEPRSWKGGMICSWAVCLSKLCLNKDSNEFEWENMPSNRDKEWIKNCRFETIEEAQEYYINHHYPKVLAYGSENGVLGWWILNEDGNLGKKRFGE